MRAVVIDSNLLLLFVVGSCKPALIGKHRRLASTYTDADYARLVQFLAYFDRIMTVPQCLAEVGNLLSDGNDPDAVSIKSHFMLFIKQAVEIYVPSVQVIELPEFNWLGISDTAQLFVAGNDHELLTADGPLFAAAAQRGTKAHYFSPS